MLWLKTIRAALRLAGPYWFMPWRSPLLRWRMETYGICDERGRPLHASEITPRHFLRFLRTEGASLRRFLRWSATL